MNCVSVGWNATSSTLPKKQAENIVGATVTTTKTLNRLASARAELKAEACPLGTLGAPRCGWSSLVSTEQSLSWCSVVAATASSLSSLHATGFASLEDRCGASLDVLLGADAYHEGWDVHH